jgi:TolB-like protein
LKKARPGVVPEMEQIIGQALAKKPADRYKTMEEFREDMEAVAEGLKPLKAKRRRVRKILGIRTAYVYSALVILLALILGLNVGGLRNLLLGRAAPAPAIRLAVLPFENLSGDPQQDYFSDGMTQEMIAQLGCLHPETLSVIARTSVMRYKKTNTPIDQIGRDLNVEYVLEGSAQREGTRVRITAELIKVRDQSQLWSDSCSRPNKRAWPMRDPSTPRHTTLTSKAFSTATNSRRPILTRRFSILSWPLRKTRTTRLPTQAYLLSGLAGNRWGLR